MNNISVSICIAVYNGERFLAECLDSVCAQTIKEKEVIVIDDGSTDATATILEKYAEKYPFFFYRHQNNMGTSIARAEGIKLARGRFVGIVDADDTIAPDMYEKMVAVAEREGADIVDCDPRGSENGCTTEGMAYDAEDVLRRYLGINDMPIVAMWTRLYSKELFNGDVFFTKKGPLLLEDAFATPVLIAKAKKIYYMPTGNNLYHHRPNINPESASRRSYKYSTEEYHRRILFAYAPEHFLHCTGRIDLKNTLEFHVWMGSCWYQILRVGTNAGIDYKKCMEDICRISGKNEKLIVQDVLLYEKAYGKRFRYLISKIIGIQKTLQFLRTLNVK